MKTLFFLIIFLLTANFITAQDEKIVHIGFNVSPVITTQIFDIPAEATSESLFGYSLSVNIFYDISSIIEIKSGINYHINNLNQLDYSPMLGCDINPVGGINPLNSWYEDRYKAHYIGIPIEVRFKLLGDKNHFYAKTGFEPFFKIGQSAKSVLVECGTNELDLTNSIFGELNSILYKVKFGLGFEFEMTKKINLYIEPEISYSINKVFKIRTNNSRMLNFGLIIGTRI